MFKVARAFDLRHILNLVAYGFLALHIGFVGTGRHRIRFAAAFPGLNDDCLTVLQRHGDVSALVYDRIAVLIHQRDRVGDGFAFRHIFGSNTQLHRRRFLPLLITGIVRAGLHRIRGKLRAAVKADVQTAQVVDTVQQVAAAIFVIAAAACGAVPGGGTGCGHQIFAQGREKVLTGDLHTVHLEGRHLFFGIGGIEALQADGGPVLKGQDEIVAAAAQGRSIGGKIKDEAPVGSAGDGLDGTGGGSGKTNIGHDGILCWSTKLSGGGMRKQEAEGGRPSGRRRARDAKSSVPADAGTELTDRGRAKNAKSLGC